LIFISSSIFAKEINELEKAIELEKKGKYKEANELYKTILKSKSRDKYLLDLSKNQNHEVETFTLMKKNFYKEVDKSQDKETNENLEQMITGNFGLYPYKKNYLLPISYDTKKRNNREQFETVFQFSIEKPIAYNFLGFNEAISFAYTQKSFWQTGADSSPFRETNYYPEIFLQFPYKNSEILKGYKISLMHHSNGRNNENSRSWNRLYVEGYLQLSKVFLIPKLWYRIPEESKDDDNSDIHNFYGYGDITILYPYKKHTFELMIRNNLKSASRNKGAVALDWTFPLLDIIPTNNFYGFVHIFSGYGDSLIDYNKEVNRIGFGITFSR
jgi:phospholipase A1